MRVLCAALLLSIWAQASLAVGVPLPRPRPASAPQPPPPAAAPTETAPANEGTPPADSAQPPGAAAPPPPSACRLALTEAIAIAPSVPAIHGPGGCGGDDLVRLEAVVLPDGARVSVKPAALLRCEMARAMADFVRTDLVAWARGLGSVPAALDNFDSYECRGRNRVAGAMLSEHGHANALDVRAIVLASGRVVSLTDRNEPRAVREAVEQSACARFSTILGPGSDWYHEDHIHFDLAPRRSGLKICQWGVYDPLPAEPPLMPAARPAEAPPRTVARDGAPAEPADAGGD